MESATSFPGTTIRAAPSVSTRAAWRMRCSRAATRPSRKWPPPPATSSWRWKRAKAANRLEGRQHPKKGPSAPFFQPEGVGEEMAEISAGLVKELRELTGLGMMECKKALAECEGDLKKAEELLRIKSGAKASKAASRIAAEGVIGAWLAADGKVGALVELNSETDFVAKNEDFVRFAQSLAELVATRAPANVEELASLDTMGAQVEARRQALVQKIGENISIRRFR